MSPKAAFFLRYHNRPRMRLGSLSAGRRPAHRHAPCSPALSDFFGHLVEDRRLAQLVDFENRAKLCCPCGDEFDFV